MPRTCTLVLAAVALLASGCSASTTAAPARGGSFHAHASQHADRDAGQDAGCRTVVVAAGDIVDDVRTAGRTGALATAQHPDQVLVLGDNQYDRGALEDYRSQYDRTPWGGLKPLTNPVPGNHEYETRGAAGYFTYFGAPPAYYAYDAGCGWRGFALNSEVDLAAESEWLRRDLAAHPGTPVLASWHRPRWSSGSHHGSQPDVQPLWDALHGRTGVVLNGHEHNYERFAPVGELREFVAGTGGSSDYGFAAPAPGSQRRIEHTPGVLRLDLHARSAYTWSFLDDRGEALDAGSS